MYDYHYRKISLQLTHDPAPLRVTLSTRNKLHPSPRRFLAPLAPQPQSKYKFPTWPGTNAGRYVSYDNAPRSDGDDEVHDKSRADRPLYSNQPLSRPHERPLKPVNTPLLAPLSVLPPFSRCREGKTHNLLPLTTRSRSFITRPVSPCGSVARR